MTYVPFLAGQRATADLLNTRLIEVILDWTDLASLGSYSGNGSAGSPSPQMRKLKVMGTELWELKGRINTTGITAATTTTLFTFNVGHRVSAERGFTTFASNTGHHGARLGFQTSGALTVSVPSAAGSSMSFVLLDGASIYDPV
ncbi:hypothetical protein QCN29_26735 [Streptomyces sp. HNM0663]|uniref:Uncharacterized protein n=1 Tax=Streptomyces chengmaiensis TaxID=3040919 RepID=A0ABT6HUA9_9ACTN|nr:hypothetical protein [Streptomyces chengmaiensis]MDH2392308.1 hypothetical protein [Streptomyces chengmaiensis]